MEAGEGGGVAGNIYLLKSSYKSFKYTRISAKHLSRQKSDFSSVFDFENIREMLIYAIHHFLHLAETEKETEMKTKSSRLLTIIVRLNLNVNVKYWGNMMLSEIIDIAQLNGI